MYLISTKSYTLSEFSDDKIPRYAILSHTWGGDKEEVSYSDLISNPKLLEHIDQERLGVIKIRGSCQRAKSDEFDWLWVDTCCINKSSSAELTEAINSMYNYYERSERCHVYLADVGNEFDVWSPTPAKSSTKSTVVCFRSSRWFSRGWTLQELLAPRDVVFYSKDWDPLGVKSSADMNSESLHELLSQITGIDVKVLQNLQDVSSVSIAKRMSWAARRETTRIEDRAYSLLGIFNVNMPMLYGEGKKAFVRLQEEIMNDLDDQTLFAWESTSDPDLDRGLLAESPADFAGSGFFVRSANPESLALSTNEAEHPMPFFKTNKGLSITLRLAPVKDNLYVAALECPVPTNRSQNLGIYLRRLPGTTNQYARVRANKLVSVAERRPMRNLYIRQVVSKSAQKKIVLRYSPDHTCSYRLTQLFRSNPRKLQTSDGVSMRIDTDVQFNFEFQESNAQMVAALVFTDLGGGCIVVMIGFGTKSEVEWCAMEKPHDMNFPGLYDLWKPTPAFEYRVIEGRQSFTGGTSVDVKGYRIFVGVQSDTEISAGAKLKKVVDLTLETETTRDPGTQEKKCIKNYLVNLGFEPVNEVSSQSKVQEAILKGRAREEVKMKKEIENPQGWRKALMESIHLPRAS